MLIYSPLNLTMNHFTGPVVELITAPEGIVQGISVNIFVD